MRTGPPHRVTGALMPILSGREMSGRSEGVRDRPSGEKNGEVVGSNVGGDSAGSDRNRPT